MVILRPLIPYLTPSPYLDEGTKAPKPKEIEARLLTAEIHRIRATEGDMGFKRLYSRLSDKWPKLLSKQVKQCMKGALAIHPFFFTTTFPQPSCFSSFFSPPPTILSLSTHSLLCLSLSSLALFFFFPLHSPTTTSRHGHAANWTVEKATCVGTIKTVIKASFGRGS